MLRTSWTRSWFVNTSRYQVSARSIRDRSRAAIERADPTISGIARIAAEECLERGQPVAAAIEARTEAPKHERALDAEANAAAIVDVQKQAVVFKSYARGKKSRAEEHGPGVPASGFSLAGGVDPRECGAVLSERVAHVIHERGEHALEGEEHGVDSSDSYLSPQLRITTGARDPAPRARRPRA